MKYQVVVTDLNGVRHTFITKTVEIEELPQTLPKWVKGNKVAKYLCFSGARLIDELLTKIHLRRCQCYPPCSCEIDIFTKEEVLENEGEMNPIPLKGPPWNAG